ncbi:MAG: RNA polymerase sigma factor [Chitinophagales bacterium]
MDKRNETKKLVDHLFRHEAGKMIAILTRLFGMQHIDLAEDVVQEAFLKAMQTWAYENIPKNPAGWLMQVAKNKAIDFIRHKHHVAQYSKELSICLENQADENLEEYFHEHEIADSQLRMIFACCHPSLSPDDQLAFTLKTVSGFSAAEIARALITSEPVIQKRLFRAKQFLRQKNIQLEIPAGSDLVSRLEIVHTVIYLIFNEGYNSIKTDELIRKDLCAEAMRLCKLLSEHPCGQQPTTFALLSLMCFHASRFDSRLDEEEEIILLEDQDRTKWDKQLISLGYHFLSLSSEGTHLSIYHIESAIAAEHCLSPSFQETNWKHMLRLYDLLLAQKRTPVVLLNRAIVVAQSGEPSKAIEEVLQIPGIDKLFESQYIYCAVLGNLYLQSGKMDDAKTMLQKAYALTHSKAEKKLIAGKIMKTHSQN